MVQLIHEVLMEGNCYSWLCRLMNTLSFSQHRMLKIQAGQVVPGSSRLPPAWRPPRIPGVAPAHGPLGGDTGLGLGAQGRSCTRQQGGEAKRAGVGGKMLPKSQKFNPF